VVLEHVCCIVCINCHFRWLQYMCGSSSHTKAQRSCSVIHDNMGKQFTSYFMSIHMIIVLSVQEHETVMCHESQTEHSKCQKCIPLNKVYLSTTLYRLAQLTLNENVNSHKTEISITKIPMLFMSFLCVILVSKYYTQ
jgi:hypothetical protein